MLEKLRRLLGVRRVRGAWLGAIATCGAVGCASAPRDGAQRALYVDLRKTVQISEDAGWVSDWVRLQTDVEPALRSVCQTTPETRAALESWLEYQIALRGGPAAQRYRANGGNFDAVSETLSLEHTLALLRFANLQASACPFWLSPRPDFRGIQTDNHDWVLLAETIGFGSYVVNTHVPAFAGGGRILLGRGLGSELTLAAGAELAAGGAFIPSKGSSSLDAAFSVATPVLLRAQRFSRMVDLELAPIARFTGSSSPLPPGGRVQLGAGYSSLRNGAFMSYYMLYFGYEFHPRVGSAQADHTLQIGTRIAVDWAL